VAAARRASAREPDRLEREHPTFFEQVRAGYAARCAAQPERFLRIDADQALDAVGRVVESALLERLDVLDRPAAGTTIPAPSELGDAD
jgi:dTMP kinase